MYSIVMATAMVVAPENPDFFFKNKGGGCYGSCYGNGCYGSCYGNGCFGGGCYGGGCYGGGWGCHGSLFAHGGCYGSCYGNGCHGMGWGHKSYGGHAFVGSGCCGSTAYYTGCGGYTVPGGYYAPAGPVITGYGGPLEVYPAVPGTVVVPGTATVPPPPDAGGSKATPDAGSKSGTPGKGGSSLNTPELAPNVPAGRAQVVVRVPADARLSADGHATTLGGVERVFLTPEISTARDHQYTLKVEYPAGGEAQTQKVIVRAGHRTTVEFTSPVAAEKVTSPVTVALPEKARLFVDGVATTAAAGTTTFRTPELTRGKPYVYEFRAEVEKDGKTEVVSRQVTFTAGEPVNVNFVEGEATRTASVK